MLCTTAWRELVYLFICNLFNEAVVINSDCKLSIEPRVYSKFAYVLPPRNCHRNTARYLESTLEVLLLYHDMFLLLH
jgi:hypothetical protein